MTAIEDKRALRRRILSLRRALPPAEAGSRSLQVLRALWSSGLLLGRRTVALYAAAGGEVETRLLFHQLRAEGMRVALPRVRGGGPELDFFAVSDWEGLLVSRLRIPEPAPVGEPLLPSAFDLMVVPGVAFDRCGGRLGYGMGCYDRVLVGLRPEAPRVGLGYDFQLLPRVPREAHDVPLSAVVTESEIVLVPTGTGDYAYREKGERPCQ